MLWSYLKHSNKLVKVLEFLRDTFSSCLVYTVLVLNSLVAFLLLGTREQAP